MSFQKALFAQDTPNPIRTECNPPCQRNYLWCSVCETTLLERCSIVHRCAVRHWSVLLPPISFQNTSPVQVGVHHTTSPCQRARLHVACSLIAARGTAWNTAAEGGESAFGGMGQQRGGVRDHEAGEAERHPRVAPLSQVPFLPLLIGVT